MSRGGGAGAWAWVVALVLGGCSSHAPSKHLPATEAPAAGEGGAPYDATLRSEEAEKTEAAEPGEELPALDARLDAAWRELSTLDEAQQKSAVAAGTPATEPGAGMARCERIRGLADEICTLSDRMCTLATEHPDEGRYADACARAGDTCRSARKAAERCPAA